MAPYKVVMFRHAEKADNDGLSPIGKYRACMLSNLLIQRYPSMKGIYAAGVGPGDSSVRKVQTVAPLISEMVYLNPSIAMNTVYLKYEYVKAAEEIKTNPTFNNQIVLVCWSHATLPLFAKELGARNVPKIWPIYRFDMLWEIHMKTGILTQIPQLLLCGDSCVPIINLERRERNGRKLNTDDT
ncbi:histidine phosphatase family protein [Sutcliffiella rhizosphaerae]|uniref:Histidine phosphatase family protein n=1 Tax=Sutcliffiella rhizosphaerae TaxID=2880967 RepID=A0ABM8YQN1_9BACI|nr:histidine phosphatase family protein [Sutcliffiella rhizosphaerae]CAG9622313.1 hypothetical protein BACCIP111883_03104 [Sutcliffiella rhizosphaerae]